MEMTKSILHLTKLPRPDDAADALGAGDLPRAIPGRLLRYEGL